MTAAAERELTDIAAELLTPHPANRKHFDPTKLDELTANIRLKGIHTPILVRPIPVDGFQILAGERRWRAAKAAGLETVPCIVRSMSDDEALELLLTENLQREDPHPIEEAETYAAWLDRPDHDVKSLAAKIGKSVAHIYARLQLRTLCPTAREVVWNNGLPIGHALVLARVTEPQQTAVLDKLALEAWRGIPPLGAFTRMVTAAGEILSEAPFDREDASLCPAAGTCAACPKRLHFKDGIFPELAAELDAAKNNPEGSIADDLTEDRCLDPGCFQEKVDAHVAQAIETARADHGEALVLLRARAGDAYPAKASAPLPRGLWKKVTKKTGGAVPGIFVKADRMMDGPKLGELLWVTLKPRPKDGAKPKSAGPSVSSVDEEWKKREAERAARIAKEQPRRIALAQAVLARVPGKLDIGILTEIAINEIHGYSLEQAAKLLKVKAPKKLSVKSKPAEIMVGITLGLVSNDLQAHACGAERGEPENLLALAQRFGVDAKKVLAKFDAADKAGGAKK